MRILNTTATLPGGGGGWWRKKGGWNFQSAPIRILGKTWHFVEAKAHHNESKIMASQPTPPTYPPREIRLHEDH